VTSARAVLITGASGLVGRRVVARLAGAEGGSRALETVVALDVRPVERAQQLPGVVYETGDIRDPELAKRLEAHGIDTVVHLAAVVTPGPESTRELEYEVDVLGTENVLRACVAAGVRRLVYTSSGAAYGYHADAPQLLDETQPLRGNPEFAYADHKRLAEEALARCREEHPELEQLVLRSGTILGESVASPISAIFDRPVVVGVRGAATPFVLIWDEDVAACIAKGVLEGRSGIYNLTGDGAITLREIAHRLRKPFLPLPAWLLDGVLRSLQALGLSSRGPEQVDFLRYRPVLSNERLKRELGFTPRTTSDGCFERYRAARFAPPPQVAGLRDAVVVVTGGGSGIGAALARRAARIGARVAVLDRDIEAATSVAAPLADEGRSCIAIACDVTSLEACEAAVAEVSRTFGGIDVLVNNAGITHLGRFGETDLDVLRRVMEVNFFGALHCTRAALPSLLERRGAIVVLGSVAGLAPLATRTGYAASKHALHGFFESLRAEHLDDGLHVLLVDPSFVDTPIGSHALGPDGGPAGEGARTGVDHPISPERVADEVLLALGRRRSHLYVPWRAALYVWIARLAPRWFARAMARRTAAGTGA
jgi:UDP-glucose 4-epimerase